MKKHHLLLLLLLVASLTATAQCKDNSFAHLDGNQVDARFHNGANFFWDMVGESRYEVPRGSGNHVAFAGGLWVGGFDPQGELHLAGSTYRQTGWDWYAGPVRQPAPYTCATSIETSSDIFYDGIKQLSNGKLLVLTVDEVIIYDPVTRLSILRPLPAPRVWMDAIELPDGRIFLYGDDVYPTKNPVMFMDTATYTLVGGPTLHWFHQESSADLLPNGTVLLAGVVGCEIFDPGNNLSATVPDMLWPRMKHGTATLPNGDIMAVGGGSSLNGTGLTLFTQYFNVAQGYWFPGPAMSMGRQRAKVTPMPDGKFFISGGNNFGALTDIYDPILDTIYPGPPLPGFTNAHAVSVLDSHLVLIAAEGSAVGKSELYKFDIGSGAAEQIGIQRSGPRSILLNPNEVLVEVEDWRHLQRIELESYVQDDDRWQYIWKMSRAEIDSFRADFLAGNVDFAQYPQIAHWPAHGNEAIGEERNIAPFVDVNMDGLYRPETDGDYPCIVGDQALWWVFNDAGPHAESQGRPLGIQVEAMAYAFDCSQSPCPDTSLDYATFLHYELTNRSDTAYHDIYLGNVQDFDIGSFGDDYTGCDSSLSLAIGYNFDDNDPNYGDAPPAWGAAVLPNGQIDAMSTFMYYENTIGLYNSNPSVPSDYYNYMRSRFRDSLHVVANGLDGYPLTAAGPPTNFMYPSTDGFCGGPVTGWNEYTAGNQAFDRRFLQASGPVDLAAGERIQWDIAFLYARDSSNQQSVCKLKAATSVTRGWWQNQLDRGCFNTIVARAEPVAGSALKVYPNPSGLGFLALDWEAASLSEGVVELVDLQGRVVLQQRVQPGVSATRLAVTGMAAGMYVVRVACGGSAMTQKVVLQ